MAKKPAKPVTVEDFKELRLIELGAENFKRVRAVRIRPSGALTQISGRNGQGKSSVIEAFLSLFEGKAGVAVKPIRLGEEEAKSYAILGKDGAPIVTVSQRIWEKKGGGLAREVIVEGADGTSFTHPQTIASALYAPIAFDPFEFQRMDAKAKVELLKRLVPGVDFGKLASERKALFDKRTDVGRERDRAKGAALAIEVPHGTPAEPVDEGALVAELAGVAEHNSLVDRRAAGRLAAQAEIDEKNDEAERLTARIATLTREVQDLEAKLAKAEALPAKKDVASLESAIAAARGINASVRLRLERDQHAASARDLEAEYDVLTHGIEALDKRKADAVASAKLPVPELEFDDDGVALNGLPFEQASSAEQLKASTLLAMAMNPDLRVIIIREGSLLDDDSLELLTAMAGKHGFDLLVERVTNGEKVGIVIEDGEVAS